MRAMVPSSSTRMLPGCGSEWKIPASKICVRNVSSRRSASSRGANPSSCNRAVSAMLVPTTRSSVSTRPVESSGTTAGTRTPALPASTSDRAVGVGRLDAEVQLLADVADELGRQLRGPHRQAERRAPFDQARELHDGGAVPCDEVVEAWALHLDDHRPAVRQFRRVDLRDRRTGHRSPVEAAVDADPPAGRARPPAPAGWTPRRPVPPGCANGPAPRTTRGQQIGPRRGDLAQLDEHPTGLLEGLESPGGSACAVGRCRVTPLARASWRTSR